MLTLAALGTSASFGNSVAALQFGQFLLQIHGGIIAVAKRLSAFSY
jgi:hypothetical protein